MKEAWVYECGCQWSVDNGAFCSEHEVPRLRYVEDLKEALKASRVRLEVLAPLIEAVTKYQRLHQANLSQRGQDMRTEEWVASRQLLDVAIRIPTEALLAPASGGTV